MTIPADDRMRLTVLGGYLGSGKTTWLRHQLHAGHYEDAFVVVNEAAETPVDDALLARSLRLVTLAGGCACCEGLGDLIVLLRSICDERSRSHWERSRLTRIVLETSGLADPAPIAAAIRTDPVLVHHVVVNDIVVAVDALNGLAHLRADSLGRRQAETADRLVVTKVDEADPAAVARLLAALRFLNPGAAVCGAVKGSQTRLPVVAGAEALPDLAQAPDRPPVFATKLTLGGLVDWTAFTVWLSALLHARGDDVVRVKGVVRTPAGRLLLQSVRGVVQSPEILPEANENRDDNTIVVIGRGYRSGDLRRSLEHFAGARGVGSIALTGSS